MRRHAVTILATFLTTWAIVAHAQDAPWRLVQENDGTLYVIAGGTRHRIVPATLPGDIIAAIPEAEPGEDGRIMVAPAPSGDPVPLTWSATRPHHGPWSIDIHARGEHSLPSRVRLRDASGELVAQAAVGP